MKSVVSNRGLFSGAFLAIRSGRNHSLPSGTLGMLQSANIGMSGVLSVGVIENVRHKYRIPAVANVILTV